MHDAADQAKVRHLASIQMFGDMHENSQGPLHCISVATFLHADALAWYSACIMPIGHSSLASIRLTGFQRPGCHFVPSHLVASF